MMHRAAVWVAAAALCAVVGCKQEDPGTPQPSGSGGLGGAAGVMVSGGAGGMMLSGGAGGTGAVGGMGGAGGTSMVDAGDGWVEPGERLDLFNGPRLLSDAGLYTDLPNGVLAEGVVEYEPLGELWSDGATKKRWLKLPPGTVIDTANMDDWIFPVDTRVFKEFSKDGKRIETRMVWKRGEGDWPMVAYLWKPDQSEAFAAPDGQVDASMTDHDVPDASKCGQCHDGRVDRILGVGALQLSHNKPGLTIDTLIAENKLSAPPAAPLVLPGDAATQEGLAYLHANCGNCHNPHTQGADRLFSVYFWQEADALATLEDTVTYRSLVTDRTTPYWIDAVNERMATRMGKQKMPPLATEVVDPDGMAKVGALMARFKQDLPALPPRATSGTCPDPQPLFDLFQQVPCGGGFCHSNNGGPGATLSWTTPEELLTAVLTNDAEGDGCGMSGIARVEPGDASRSLLYLKLLPGPPCGIIMPPQQSLTAEQLDMVKNWINACTPTP